MGWWSDITARFPRMLVALPALHPLAERDVVHWTDLRGERFLLPAADPGPEIRDLLLGRLAISGGTPDIRMPKASRETVLSVLGSRSEISIVCEGSTAARYPDVVYGPSLAVGALPASRPESERAAFSRAFSAGDPMTTSVEPAKPNRPTARPISSKTERDQ